MGDTARLTTAYEQWLGEHLHVVPAGLERKHQEMAADEYRFLRGTYYLWLVRVADRCPELLTGTAVPLVGDLHVENYGTWRDARQVRRWGVNDLDELATGPAVLDLVRLAASAVLAPHLALSDKDVCSVVLSAYLEARPRVAVDLTEPGAGHLRGLVPEFADTAEFYARLTREPAATGVPDAVMAAADRVAETGWRPTWHQHEAGTGSMGHQRFAGVGPAADGSLHAREAKQLGPGTAQWAATVRPGSAFPQPDEELYQLVNRAMAGPTTAVRVAGWQVRDLAPDVVRIELSGLPKKDSERLLRSMAYAVADVHGSDPAALDAATGELRGRPDGWLHDRVRLMVEVTRADFADYRASRHGG